MSKKIELSKDEAKLIFGGAQTGSGNSVDNVNKGTYCTCTFVDTCGVTNTNSADVCICVCVKEASVAQG
jgi:hypothetical protein